MGSRTQRLAAALTERGELERTRAVLQRYISLGGEQTAEISTALLSVCAALSDAAGAEAAAASLATMAPLNDMQMALLQRAVGEDRVEDFGSAEGANGAVENTYVPPARARQSLGSSAGSLATQPSTASKAAAARKQAPSSPSSTRA